MVVIALVALLALVAASRRGRGDVRLHDELDELGERLELLAERIDAAARRPAALDAGLGEAIGSTIDLGEVMRRTLAATGAVPGVDGGEIEVVTESGAVVREVRGLSRAEGARLVGGPPDARPYGAAVVAYSYADDDAGAIRSALAVPLGEERELGTLVVYSRLDWAFEGEAIETLKTLSRRATPAVANAIRHRAMAELSITDELTGLLNRRGYNQALEREIAVARRSRRPLALIIADLDFFSRVNNEFGLPAGDAVLAQFAQCLVSAVRVTDIPCRRGGEEFAIILPDTTCEQGLSAYNRIRGFVAATEFALVGPMTFSAGLTDLRDGDTHADVDARASDQEKNAKATGRDQLQVDCLGHRPGS